MGETIEAMSDKIFGKDPIEHMEELEKILKSCGIILGDGASTEWTQQKVVNVHATPVAWPMERTFAFKGEAVSGHKNSADTMLALSNAGFLVTEIQQEANGNVEAVMNLWGILGVESGKIEVRVTITIIQMATRAALEQP